MICGYRLTLCKDSCLTVDQFIPLQTYVVFLVFVSESLHCSQITHADPLKVEVLF